MNELSLRGGPTGGDTLLPLVLPRPPANYDPETGRNCRVRRRTVTTRLIVVTCSADVRVPPIRARSLPLLFESSGEYRLMAARIPTVTPDGFAGAKKKKTHDLQLALFLQWRSPTGTSAGVICLFFFFFSNGKDERASFFFTG